ncbi:MAG: PQQ-binding-like beta-propeller repeat protein, partial [Deltaproteobacteria bacterium]|nr:PQQ-binding-like beta-propeller repeat protein [Deltaproteobacteria bacterium]
MRQTDVDTTPVIDGDVIYAAAFGEGPAAVRVADGGVAWRGRWFGSTRPEVAGDLLVFGTSDGEVVAVRKSDGGAEWLARLDGGAAYPPP